MLYLLKKVNGELDGLFRARARASIQKAGLWFVDIPRTSSTSVKIELGRHFGGEYQKSFERESDIKRKKYFHDHIPAVRMRKSLRDSVWEQLFTFSIVRNPWDRFLSLYRFRIALGDLPREVEFNSYVKMLKNVRYRSKISPYAELHYHMSMCDFLMDSQDHILVNRVYRLEEREEMVSELESRFDITLRGIHKERLSNEKNYRKYYDDESAELISCHYSDDISYFCYEF